MYFLEIGSGSGAISLSLLNMRKNVRFQENYVYILFLLIIYI